MTRFKLLTALAATLCAVGLAWGQTNEQPLRSVTDPGVITTRQAITPAGVQSVFKGRVQGVAFGKPGELFVLTRTHIYRMDWLNNTVLGQKDVGGVTGLKGLAFDNATNRPVTAYVELAKAGQPGQVRLATADGAGIKTLGEPLGKANVGQVTMVGAKALVPLMADNQLAIVDTATGATTKVSVGVAPFATAASATTAYVSNWGGTAALESELSAPTGLEPNADRVRIDTRGVAQGGTVSVVNLASAAVTATIPVGRHPTALALDAKGQRLYVANTNDETITVIDTKTNRVRTTWSVQPFAQQVAGLAPSALALDPAGKRLYVALGGANAIAVLDLPSGRIAGLIPTSWYPASLDVSADGKQIAVGTLLGVGSGQNEGPTKRFVHANRGAAHVIEVPDPAQLASYSAAVAENNRMTVASAAAPRPNLRTAPKAVPARAGEPSLIEHVVYIIKENRTYDQLYGDLPRGKGEPSFVMYGEDVTPNHRRLALDFVLLDNFYATGGNSANGHQWVTQANEASYTLWPGYAGRSYPFDGSDPLAYSAKGFLWDAALSRKKTVAAFGEYAPRLSWTDTDRDDLLKRWQAGETIVPTWTTTSPIPPLDSVLVRDFPAYSMGVPDVVRAQIFLKHLARYEAEGKMPNLTILQLPCDHTMGTRPGSHTPKAMVADNDLALGLVVEALTKSKFWPKMAILVVEDDSQNGVDHVDGHRTVALAISPYTRRGSVDSTFYSHQSMVKTIELMLGLPTLSLFDLIATDMRASFTDTADLRPYTAVTPRQSLVERNPDASKLAGARLNGALASATMRWDVPDAVPSDKLNRIVWHEIKGWDTPYPTPRRAAFSPFQMEDDEAEDQGDGETAP